MMQLARNFPRPVVPRNAEWLDQVFQCRAVQTGGVIRRQVVDVEREVGRAAFVQEVRRRGFRLIRSRNYYIVVCESDPITLVI